MTDINKILSSLSPEKRALLEQRLKKDSQKYNSFPLSFAQRRLWFLDQLDPGSATYNIPVAIRMKGDLKIDTLKKSIEKIIIRHEVLRSKIITVNETPMQIVKSTSSYQIKEVNLIDLEEKEKENKLKELIQKNSSIYFNLSEEPLFKILLYRINQNDYVLQIVMHHIISDGWSVGIFIREFSICYQAYLIGEEPILPELQIQYADFAQWQREWSNSENFKKQLKYWKEQFEYLPDPLELPIDFTRQPMRRQFGSTLISKISKSLFEKAKSFSNEEGISMFMLTLTVFNLLIHKYTQQTDIPIGIPIANRNRSKVENLLGFFVNTLVIRANINTLETFSDLLNNVKETSLNSFDNQDIPFDILIEELQPNRNLSQTPLFQIMFDYQTISNQNVILQDLKLEAYPVDSSSSKFDLTFTIGESAEDGFELAVEYDTDLFEKRTIIRITKHFEKLLDEVLSYPNNRIQNLSVISDDERTKILYEWNTRTIETSKVKSIHSLVERWALKTPNEIAVVSDNENISYKNLNEKANQLANYLLRKNKNRNLPIGISLDKSVNLLVTVLGVLKSGFSYLPLDPSYPEERLNYMINDSEIELLITDQNNSEVFSTFSYNKIVIEDLKDLAQFSKENPNVDINKNDLAYVIYTSGSTGKAKGTMIQHNSLINIYLGWEKDYNLLEDVKNHLQMASFSFDVFGGDWTRALCSGGKLVLVNREQLLEAKDLHEIIIRENIDIAEFVPAVLRNLIEYVDGKSLKLDTFKILIAGSDIWYVKEYNEFKKYCSPNTRLINSFGLTEAAIDSTFFEADNLVLSEEKLVPIGKPFPNVNIYILDNNLSIVPVGVKGELYISGVSLARGYYNRPYLTAERFLPNLYSNIKGDRLYKTGDVARYLPDGNIEFFGRADNQLKLRGFRIELGEIENALSENEHIKDSIVIAREDTVGDKRLVAYVLSENGTVVDPKILREFVAERVPDYMIPSAIVLLKKYPLTPNGKVDRKSLPVPDYSLLESSMSYVEPTSKTEEILCGIIAKVLDIPQIGIKQNFFEMGGHSLLATKCILRIRDSFSIEAPLNILFEAQDVEAIAKFIDKALMENLGIKQTPITLSPREDKISLSFAQERLWFFDQLNPNNSAYNIPEAVLIKGNLNLSIFEDSLNYLIERHEILRTSIQTSDGQAFQKVHSAFKIELTLLDYSYLLEQEKDAKLKNKISEEANEPFELNKIPLIRTVLIKTDEDENVFLLTMHHIISDGWSTSIFVNEFTQIYTSLSNNRSVNLPQIKIQYADFSIWQRNWLKGEVLDKQVEYWRKQLDSIVPVLNLPTDHSRPAVQTFNGNFIQFNIDGNISNKLSIIAKENNATLFMVLLSAFNTLLYKYSGQDDICIGTPVANRNRSEVEGLIGFFVNTVVVRGKLDGNPSFKTLIERVREASIGAFSHQDLPFEKMIDMLNIERNVSHSPVFQVMFTFQNLPETKISLSDITLEQFDIPSNNAKFDLNLTMFEGTDGELVGAFEYNTDLYESRSIEKMIDNFKHLIESISENSNTQINNLSLLNRIEQKKVIQKLNKIEEVKLNENLVHQSFENSVSKFPDVTAMVFNDLEMSYKELNEKSNQLANKLKTLGVDPDVIVGMYIDRSFEMIIGLLGILKAGGAYLSLDPNYPKERLDYLINDSGIKIVISKENINSKIEDHNLTTIFVNTEELETYDKNNLNSIVTENNLSYVIYTSGSTGKPKGTLITHKGLQNYLSWCLNEYPVAEGRGSIVHSTISFDATITSVFPSLISGKAIFLVDEKSGIDGLADCLLKYKDFSLIKITPAHLELLSQQILKADASDLTKSLVVGGEDLTSDKIKFWQNNASDTLIYNEYGPTETVVGCVVHEASKDKVSGSVSIGKPLQNTQVYVLDKLLTAVPEGMTGELYIGGLGVARGYLNKPELTADKFIPNPFGDELGDRIYKTGDLVRVLNDGNLIFLGRADDQVKIRGYRIELGEINSILNNYEDLKDAIAIIREDKPNIKRLVAYYISNAKGKVSTNDLRDYASQKLPDYMVPALFVEVDEFPLTTNGKVDRKELPVPDLNNIDVSTKYESPTTENEIIIAEAVQQVLNISKVGIHDNFFELGGDSIIGIQVISKVKQAGISITPVQLFQHQTIHKLARVATKSKIIKAEQGIVTGALQFIPIQKSFIEENFENRNHWNQSLLFKVNKKLDKNILLKSIQKISSHHDALRIRLSSEENELQIVPEFDSESYEWIDLNNNQTGTIEQKCSNVQQSLDIKYGPIFKIVYFDLGENEGRLLFVIHHMAVDGVSWRILLEDFQIIYSSLEKNIEYELPPKTTSFKEWSEELLLEANSESKLDERRYWIEKAEKFKESIKVDFEDGLNDEKSEKTISLVLDETLTTNLLKEVNKKYNTKIDDILLSALVLSYSQWSGKRSMFLNLEGHGRNSMSDQIDLSRTIGWFTTIYPLHLELKKAVTIGESVKIVKEQIRKIPNDGLGYGILRYLSDDSELKNKLTALDRIELTFNYLGQFDNILPSDSIFEPAKENKGLDRAINNKRSSLIDVSGNIFSNQLRIIFNYSTNLFKDESISEWINLYMQSLKEIILDCTTDENASFTSSDFGLSNLNDKKLDKVLAKLKKK